MNNKFVTYSLNTIFVAKDIQTKKISEFKDLNICGHEFGEEKKVKKKIKLNNTVKVQIGQMCLVAQPQYLQIHYL